MVVVIPADSRRYQAVEQAVSLTVTKPAPAPTASPAPAPTAAPDASPAPVPTAAPNASPAPAPTAAPDGTPAPSPVATEPPGEEAAGAETKPSAPGFPVPLAAGGAAVLLALAIALAVLAGRRR